MRVVVDRPESTLIDHDSPRPAAASSLVRAGRSHGPGPAACSGQCASVAGSLTIGILPETQALGLTAHAVSPARPGRCAASLLADEPDRPNSAVSLGWRPRAPRATSRHWNVANKRTFLKATGRAGLRHFYEQRPINQLRPALTRDRQFPGLRQQSMAFPQRIDPMTLMTSGVQKRSVTAHRR